MQLEVYSKNKRERLGLINMVKYVQYSNKFNAVGSFEIKVPINEPSLKYLVEGNYILFEREVAGVIKYRNKETAESTEITIKGFMLKHILSYRAFLLTKIYKGKVAEIGYKMVDDLCIHNEDPRRNIDFISNSNVVPESDNIVFQKTGAQLNVALEDLLSTSSFGYDLVPDIIAYDEEKGTNINSFEFRILKPTIRTITNSEGNNPVVFAIEMNNLSQLSYVEDSTKYCTTAIVASEGEGEERTIVETGDLECSGIDRIELYVDARDLQSEDEEEVFLTPEEYREILLKRGKEKLLENQKFINFDCSVLTDENTSFKYNEDFFLGDFVTIFDRQLNLQFDLQITEVTKTITSSGEEKLDMFFGAEKMTVQKLIKRGGLLNGN